MNTKLKILQTPVRFFPDIGGVENHVYYLSKELVKNSISVEVICAGDPKLPSTKDNIKITRLHSPFKITNTDITPHLPLKLFHSNFDIIHTHMPTPWTSDWSILIAKLKNKKSIITVHNDMQKSGFIAKLVTDIYLNTFFRLALRLVDRIIIVNPDWEKSFTYTKHLFDQHKNKISIIPNGVDTSLFKPKGKRFDNNLLFVSVLDKYHKFKGFDYLLKAMVAVKVKYPKVKLQVVGEGELLEEYLNQVKNLKLENNVLFLGEKQQEDLPKIYGSSSMFILPSIHTEGYGIVLLEAAACGTPLITTTIAGLSTDISKFKAGSVIRPKDVESLSKAIINTLDSKDLRKAEGTNALQMVKSKYSWINIAKEVSKLYKI